MMQKKLLNTVACPKCFSKLTYDEKMQKLICQYDQLAFAIIDGIPVLLENEAEPIPQADSQE